MYKTITLELATGEDQDFPFLACGTTSIRYKMIFGKELFGEITSIVGSLDAATLAKITAASQKAAEAGQDEVKLDELDPDTLKAFLAIAGSGKLDTVSKMAYIMNRQAEKAEMNKLNLDTYLDWLEQFETLTFLTHALDFISLYMDNREGTSALKKSPAPSIVK